DADLPAAQPAGPARSGPPIRRRPAPPAAALAPPPPPLPKPAPPVTPTKASLMPTSARVTPSDGVVRQSAQLRKLLAEVGPRRTLLAVRLGQKDGPLPDKVMLARFRAAGLEREF